jgi:hypothetical protein
MIAMIAVREFDNGVFNGEDPLADSTRTILDVFRFPELRDALADLTG